MYITTLAASGTDLVRVSQPTGTLTRATALSPAAPSTMPAYDMAPLLRAPGVTKPVSFKPELKPVAAAQPLSVTPPAFVPPSYGSAPTYAGTADTADTADSDQPAPVAKAGLGGVGLLVALGAALFLLSGGKRRR